MKNTEEKLEIGKLYIWMQPPGYEESTYPVFLLKSTSMDSKEIAHKDVLMYLGGLPKEGHFNFKFLDKDGDKIVLDIVECSYLKKYRGYFFSF